MNYQTTEIAFRRLHAIERAFSNVHSLNDWKAQKGQKNWKTKVQYALLDEIDAHRLSEGGSVIESVEREVRERLQQKALLQKALLKVPGSPGEGGPGE